MLQNQVIMAEPSKAWFLLLVSSSWLHKIKSKPWRNRRRMWNDGSKVIGRRLNNTKIKKKNIINFDEAAFRICCPEAGSY